MFPTGMTVAYRPVWGARPSVEPTVPNIDTFHETVRKCAFSVIMYATHIGHEHTHSTMHVETPFSILLTLLHALVLQYAPESGVLRMC